MPYSVEDKFVIAVSSRALFNLDEENRIYEDKGDQEYKDYQRSRTENAAQPGVAFPLIQKLLMFNSESDRPVEVVILSRNDPYSGLRVFFSCKEHNLDVTRGVFTQGRSPFQYLKPFNSSLFLSAKEDDVKGALQEGVPAARVYTNPTPIDLEDSESELRIAFDGDGVLFDDSCERIFKERGLEAFLKHEADHAKDPIPPGPFFLFLKGLHDLQKRQVKNPRIKVRTALITARNAPAHERAVLTLSKYGIEIDEAMFLGGVEKRGFIEAFRPDFFFDDQTLHTDSAALVSATGHVPVGVANEIREFALLEGQISEDEQ